MEKKLAYDIPVANASLGGAGPPSANSYTQYVVASTGGWAPLNTSYHRPKQLDRLLIFRRFLLASALIKRPLFSIKALPVLHGAERQVRDMFWTNGLDELAAGQTQRINCGHGSSAFSPPRLGDGPFYRNKCRSCYIWCLVLIFF